MGSLLRVIAVDDEEMALKDLAWLLEEAPQVSDVQTASSGADALRILNECDDIDAIFVDVQMPGLNGIELVSVLRNFKNPPQVVFVTAYDSYAVTAFELEATDYLLKPVAQDRLAKTLDRIATRSQMTSTESVNSSAGLPRLVSRVGERSTVIERSDVIVVEAEKGYSRVHLEGTSYLVGDPISTLASAWSSHGFVRIHRSFLVLGSAIDEVIVDNGKRTIRVGAMSFPVSRRYTKLLQDHLDGSP